jgi:uncharacterized protein YciI
MKHYLLFYETVDDFLDKRAGYRSVHLEYARASVEKGDLLLGGALADPPDGAVLLFQGESADVAETFARNDPYVVNGLIKSWRVRHWTTVVGEGAATVVRP